jgi:hypothetical protein
MGDWRERREKGYEKLTREEAMKAIEQEYPEFVKDAEQKTKDFEKNPERFLKKAGAIKDPVVSLLSTLDSYY